ncbi:hypothetical protein [Streptomyces sp. NPDC005423]|uniref:hypothetical protein n=1 Tax=Streptomyces sp. NPDC005423 TaxID=3155343 RepID=UPI0033B70580
MTDTYQALKEALAERLGGSPQVLERIRVLDHQPGAPTERLVHDLIAYRAVDAAVVRHAQQLLALADAAGSRAAIGRIDLRGARGVQFGDGNTQHNTFGQASD